MRKPNITYITTCNIEQVLYPVGILKEAYSIISYFSENIETGIIISKHKVEINSTYEPPKRRTLLEGTSKECVECLEQIYKDNC